MSEPKNIINTAVIVTGASGGIGGAIAESVARGDSPIVKVRIFV
jgi:short-subunit dehydrogenase